MTGPFEREAVLQELAAQSEATPSWDGRRPPTLDEYAVAFQQLREQTAAQTAAQRAIDAMPRLANPARVQPRVVHPTNMITSTVSGSYYVVRSPSASRCDDFGVSSVCGVRSFVAYTS